MSATEIVNKVPACSASKNKNLHRYMPGSIFHKAYYIRSAVVHLISELLRSEYTGEYRYFDFNVKEVRL